MVQLLYQVKIEQVTMVQNVQFDYIAQVLAYSNTENALISDLVNIKLI